MQYIFFDTNIYRQLGINYPEKTDYVNIRNFEEKGLIEFLILDIVEKEFLDYFENEIITPITEAYTNIHKRFLNNSYLPDIDELNVHNIKKSALNKFKKELVNTRFRPISSVIVYTDELVDFALANKRVSKKDNTRDYLILITLIEFASQHPKDNVVLISNDKIFVENEYFQKRIRSNNIKNLIFIESIANYLHQYGYQIDFLNRDIVLDSIDLNKIEKALRKEIDCLPSYICDYYHNNSDIPEIDELTFSDLHLYEYYSYKENNGIIKIVTSVKIRVEAIYKIEKNQDLRDLRIEKYHAENRSRISDDNRPIYDNYILFTFEGLIDMEKKKIRRQRIIDFIMDWNIK